MTAESEDNDLFAVDQTEEDERNGNERAIASFDEEDFDEKEKDAKDDEDEEKKSEKQRAKKRSTKVTSRFGEAKVIKANLKARNGVVHIIDNVL